MTVQADMQNFDVTSPAKEIDPRDGVDTEQPPEDGPRGGRWVGLNITGGGHG